jgi:predicted NAD/FAD-binding protein
MVEERNKVAVIGAGISGLACAYQLARSGHDVTLLENGCYFGGHSHTVDVTREGHTAGVDTGFLVFNHQTYPKLVQLFDELQVETVATDMSFSVKATIDGIFGTRQLEWAGTNLNTVFAQRRNLFSPKFMVMLRDILRFNREATALACEAGNGSSGISLGTYLDQHRYSEQFLAWYLLPMAACIWSCPTAQMLEFPLSSFVRFCHNHGLLQVNDRPQWHTVKGGSRNYVAKMLEAIPSRQNNLTVHSVSRHTIGGSRRVMVQSKNGASLYDHVVLACHSDQSAALLTDATATERALLGAIKYQPNRAVLHTDARCLPHRRATWSAWNYESRNQREAQVCVHYLINKLQPLPFKSPVIVSLNPITEPAANQIVDEFDYAHPVFDGPAIAAQQRLTEIQGRDHVWFAGAWTGYGFHEDGLKSGLAVATAIAQEIALHKPSQVCAA